ncbi:MAG: hypothetical protein MJZ16_14265 [Bacteroidales bacterium]|nr:hypothetical protein [Bacteroidales bacterium]
MKQQKLSAVKHNIEDVNEKALQRAILFQGTSTVVEFGKIQWLDIELPVNGSRTAPRGECVDLIGKCEEGYVLCELKFLKYNSKSNSPEYACDELQRYCKQISDNWKELEGLNLHHSDCGDFSWEDIAKDIKYGTIVKVIAGNKDYWKYWLFERRKGHCSDITTMIDKGFVLCAIDVEQDAFVLKKGDNKKYLPDIELGPWSIL